MNICEVNTPSLINQFLKLPSGIYQSDPNWTMQLGTDIEHVFNPAKNSMFTNGDARRWLLYDDWNMPAGRIAAFYSDNGTDCTGGFGFFECIENYNYADGLLDTAFTWLGEKNCNTAEGCINFGEKDRFWGTLTSGFDSPGLYLDNYNHRYYQDFFMKYGLVEKDVINTFRVAIGDVPAARMDRIAKRLQEKEQVLFTQFRFEQVEKFAADLHKVYTASFIEKNRLKYLSVDDIVHLLQTNKQAFSEDLIWLAYKNEQPIGLLVFMKDMNPSLAFGRERPAGEIPLKGFAISVLPEYRKHGIELGLCNSLFKPLLEVGGNYVFYFSGINARTTQMSSFLESLNASIVKVHKTYFYKFK